MTKSATLMLLLPVLLAPILNPGIVQAQTLLADYVGYDYESPDPIPAQFGEAGAGYHGLGFVPNLFAPLSPDTVNFQYTYYISGLTVSSLIPVGSFVIINYSGSGFIRIYEDAKLGGTAAVYGINPPNASAPSSFVDGTLFLEGSLSGFQLVLNTANNSGSYEAQFDVTGGSQYGNIPANQRSGWTFAGATGNELNRPSGYAHQIDGQIFLDRAVPASPTTWGRLKTTYR
jgi:hypothetical protein